MKYRTNFKLIAPVLDIKKANECLHEYEMAEYLPDWCHEVENYDDGFRGRRVVESIEWTLDTESEGHIDLVTCRDLSEDELAKISEWVSGQNADGLGESFEQQPFASYRDPDWDDEDDYEDSYVMASFDWETNDYIFTPLEPTLGDAVDALSNVAGREIQ